MMPLRLPHLLSLTLALTLAVSAAGARAVAAQETRAQAGPVPNIEDEGGATKKNSTAVSPSERAQRLKRLPAEAITPPRPYIRERWNYPEAGRSDPMQPPPAVASPDAFPDLTLSGIVYDVQHPELSTALVRVTGRSTGPAVERLTVRAGDRIDLIRIVRVERTRVLVEVRLLGGAEQYYLEHPKPGDAEQSGQPNTPNVQRH